MLIRNNALLREHRIAVDAEGDLVVLRIGNVEMKMPYETALKLSQWLRIRAKQAKATAGDTARHWSAVGILTDASVTRG